MFKISLFLFTADVLALIILVRRDAGRAAVLWAVRIALVCFWLVFASISLMAIRYMAGYALVFLVVPVLAYLLYRSEFREFG